MKRITSMTMGELAEQLASGALSSREITEAYLKRIDQVEDKVGAYVTVCREEALRQADEADARKARLLGQQLLRQAQGRQLLTAHRDLLLPQIE